MRKFTRLPEPDYLAARWEAWGRKWEERCAQEAGARWNWRQVDGVSLDHRLMPTLKEQTQEHCSFCDLFPTSPPSDDTIEHFRPKAQFPREAYQWQNLYYCCRYCQRKAGPFNESALRPDDLDYEFGRYFLWSYTEGGVMEVNPQASEADQERARFTLAYFRLNEGHPRLRRDALHRYGGCTAEEMDRAPYRDYLEAGRAPTP